MTTTETEKTAGPGPTQAREPAPRKRPSAATRKAQAAQQQRKPANGKTAAPEPKPKPAPEKDGPNVLKNRIADALIAFVGSEFVTRERARQIGVPFDLLQSECGRTLSYAPGKAWHKSLTSPGTGRGQRHAS